MKHREDGDDVTGSKDVDFGGVEFEAKWPSKCRKIVAEEFQIHQGHSRCDILDPSKEMGNINMAVITKVVGTGNVAINDCSK